MGFGGGWMDGKMDGCVGVVCSSMVCSVWFTYVQ